MTDDNQKPKQPLSARLALIFGITFGVVGSLVVGPQLFPKAPGQGFSVEQILCAAAMGAIGVVLGLAIGGLIERQPKD